MADEYATPPAAGSRRLPRVTIEFCTQCKWLLRAAYYAQELLSTFSTGLGEVALQPSTGGTFIVTIHHHHHHHDGSPQDASVGEDQVGAVDDGAKRTVLWDRKTDGGFPETKELKRRVRDVIEPGRDLGHVDRHHGKQQQQQQQAAKEDVKEYVKEEEQEKGQVGNECDDCK